MSSHFISNLNNYQVKVTKMSALILTHLGESRPPYIHDCIHQFRLWNPTTPAYLILEPIHRDRPHPFWNRNNLSQKIQLIYTDELTPTQQHKEFVRTYVGDTGFRKGYWRHVRERFYFIEELMLQRSLTHVISMEYDVLVYARFSELLEKFKTSHQTLRFVKDNRDRGHPAFLYIPNTAEIEKFTIFLTGLNGLNYEDMQALNMFSYMFETHCIPVLSEERQKSIPIRKSEHGLFESNSEYLSEDAQHFGILFDSLVVGQWIGGIDPRNSNGFMTLGHLNETAFYSMRELTFGWAKTEDGSLWRPILDNWPLAMIHLHSKALSCFLSDRPTLPVPDYNIQNIKHDLEPN